MQFRCVQLDLQRQLEKMDFICKFIDFAALHHYNHLMLSLGDRIRTRSYPFRAPAESYSPEEIRKIVAYGKQKDIEVFPSVPTLGHAEDFLSHPEMEELAELRHGVRGRWNDRNKVDFCASSDKVYEFFESYFREIAPLFPSPYFHIGFDEAWNIGYCEQCAPLAKTHGEAELCLGSLLRTHGILRKLGKRVIMWDDMFEYYPEILPRVPRNILMADWQYQRDVRRYEAHFVDLSIERRLEQYERLGFEYLIAPADFNFSNIRTFCEYAGDFHPFGAILTLWGKSVFFNTKSYPAVAYAGHLFAGESPSDAWRTMCDSLFPEVFPSGSAEEAALRTLLETSWIHGEMILNEHKLRCLPFFGRDSVLPAELELVHRVLDNCSVAGEPGKTVLKDLLLAVDGVLLREKIKTLFQTFLEKNGDMASFQEQLNKRLEEIKKLQQERVEFWNSQRTGLIPCRVGDFYDFVQKNCLELGEKLLQRNWVRIRFMLPVQYGAPRTALSLRSKGKWIGTEGQVYKMTRFAEDDWDRALFEYVIPVEADSPDALEISVDAYGGTGVCFAEYFQCGRHWVPDRLLEWEGTVIHPEHLLKNDAKFTWFGSGDIRLDFADRQQAAATNRIVISLKEERRKRN